MAEFVLLQKLKVSMSGTVKGWLVGWLVGVRAVIKKLLWHSIEKANEGPLGTVTPQIITNL